MAGPSRPIIQRPANNASAPVLASPSAFASNLGSIAAFAAQRSFGGLSNSPFQIPVQAKAPAPEPSSSSRGRGRSASGRGYADGSRGTSRGRGRGRGRGWHAQTAPDQGYARQQAPPQLSGPPPMRYTEDGYGISPTASSSNFSTPLNYSTPQIGPVAQQQQPSEPEQTYDCLNCRRHFRDPNQLVYHKAQHVRCSHPGCTWEGVPAEVETHREDRHLIFNPAKHRKLERTAEEEAAVRLAQAQGARIEGTNITLTTPEDISNWVAERKKRFPTLANITEKKVELSRSRPSRAEQPRSYAPGARPMNDERGRGRERGRGTARGRTIEPPTKRPKLDAPPPEPVASSSDSDLGSTSDDDAPETVPIARQPSLSASESSEPADAPSVLVVCPQWARNGKCDLGDACTQPHLGLPQQQASAPRRQPRAAPRTPFSKHTGSLLSRLLARDVAQSVSDLAHAIDFLVANDFLADVELVPGQADEQPIQEL